MSNLIPFRQPADGPAGLYLAINADSIACIASSWDPKLGQNILRIHLNNNRIVTVYEEDAESVLEALGLGEYIEGWTLDLEKDIG
jgi:hypothetical protein